MVSKRDTIAVAALAPLALLVPGASTAAADPVDDEVRIGGSSTYHNHTPQRTAGATASAHNARVGDLARAAVTSVAYHSTERQPAGAVQ